MTKLVALFANMNQNETILIVYLYLILHLQKLKKTLLWDYSEKERAAA